MAVPCARDRGKYFDGRSPAQIGFERALKAWVAGDTRLLEEQFAELARVIQSSTPEDT
jgi:hypothetical protein